MEDSLCWDCRPNKVSYWKCWMCNAILEYKLKKIAQGMLLSLWIFHQYGSLSASCIPNIQSCLHYRLRLKILRSRNLWNETLIIPSGASLAAFWQLPPVSHSVTHIINQTCLHYRPLLQRLRARNHINHSAWLHFDNWYMFAFGNRLSTCDIQDCVFYNILYLYLMSMLSKDLNWIEINYFIIQANQD